jgi:predicted small metal-binding protein
MENETESEQQQPELVVRCECGFEARAAEAELVTIVQRHGSESHNMHVTREQVLAMARPA